MDTWLIVAIPVVSALTGLITTGVVMSVGGLGVLSTFNRRLKLAEERIEDTNTRITKEVKTRAGMAALEARKNSPQKQAEEYLANPPQKAEGKPSVLQNLGIKG